MRLTRNCLKTFSEFKCVIWLRETIKKIVKHEMFIRISFLMLLMGLLTFAVALSMRSELTMEISPTILTKQGISPLSDFNISFSKEVSSEKFRDKIFIEPFFSSTYETSDNYNYLLSSNSYLPPGSSVTIELFKNKYTFNVADELKVKGLPRDGTIDNHIDGGIILDFDLSNNDSIDPKEVKNHFTISPSKDGLFKVINKQIIFVPNTPFIYNGKYTVTLKSGLTSKNGSVLCEDYSFSFRTKKAPPIVLPPPVIYIDKTFDFIGNGISVNTISSESPTFLVRIGSYLNSVDVKVYSFENAKNYSSALEQELENRIALVRSRSVIFVSEPEDFESLELCYEFNVNPVASGIPSQYVIQFPEPIDEGWYFVEISAYENTYYQYLQVSDLSVFYMWSNSNFLAWINNAKTGKPVSNAKISLARDYDVTVTTNNEGIATTSYAKDPGVSEGYDYSTFLGNMITVKAGDLTFVDIDHYYYYFPQYSANALERSHYVSYLFTDRPIYKTSDKIQVFGIAAARNSAYTNQPEFVTLKFGDWRNTFYETTVRVSSDGTFVSEVDFFNIKAGYYNLSIKVGELTLYSTYVEVSEYVKPVYISSTSTEQKVYTTESKSYYVDININLSFYDQTPVSSASVSVRSDDKNTSATSTRAFTDGSGNAKLSVALIDPNTKSSYPYAHRYVYTIDGAQSENHSGSGTIFAFHRDVMMDIKVTRGTEVNSIAVSPYKIDVSKVQNTNDIFNRDKIRGDVYNTVIAAKVYRMYYEKIPNGTRYDYSNNKVYLMYKYEKKEILVDTFVVETVKGKVVFDNLPVSDRDSCYYMVITCVDTLFRDVEEKIWLGRLYSYDNRSSSVTYSFRKDESRSPLYSNLDENNYNDYYWYWWNVRNGAPFGDLERVTFDFYEDGEPIQEMNGKFIYCTVNNRFVSYGVSSKASFTLPFLEDLVPSYILTGAYFDGKHTYLIDNTGMWFNPEKRAIDIFYKTDKKSYRPGDTVTLTVSTKNRYSGKPEANATVAISVVDEAIFAIREQYVQILDSLYYTTFYPRIYKYVSHIYIPEAESEGGMGDGGGDSPRSDFRDTAYFSTAKTNSNGETVFRFKVPDNLTSWRITSLAVTSDFHAGNTKDCIISTLPYFVLPIVNETLLVGDSLAVGCVSAGSSVEDDAEVSYQITIKGNGIKSIKETVSTVREYTSVLFDELKLPVGKYTVTVEGKSGKYKDSVLLPFEIVENRIELPIIDTFKLGVDDTSIYPLKSPVNVTFYAVGMSEHQSIVRAVQRNIFGTRGDSRLARVYASKYLTDLDLHTWDYSLDISDINGKGEMFLFPYGYHSQKFAAKAVITVPELVSKACLQYDIYDETSALTVLSQTLGGKPPNTLLYLALNCDQSDYESQIYFALSLHLAGYRTQAKTLYTNLVTNKIKQEKSSSNSSCAYIPNTGFSQNIEQCTALASLFASMLKTEDALPLAVYLAENITVDSYHLELIFFLKQFKPTSTNSGSFSYKKNGTTYTVNLKHYPVRLSFTEEQYKAADFTVKSGEIYMDVKYIGDPENLTSKNGNTIKISKIIENYSYYKQLKVGDIVKITIIPNLSSMEYSNNYGSYVIKDYLPSCLRYDSYLSGSSWYLDRQGQEMTFSYYYSSYNANRIITYYARVVTPGYYTSEGCYIIPSKGRGYGVSDKTYLLIE